MERHKKIERTEEQLTAEISRFATKWGYSEAEAKRYLMNYALNRLATLNRYSDKKPKKPKAEKKAPAHRKRSERQVKVFQDVKKDGKESKIKAAS